MKSIVLVHKWSEIRVGLMVSYLTDNIISIFSLVELFYNCYCFSFSWTVFYTIIWSAHKIALKTIIPLIFTHLSRICNVDNLSWEVPRLTPYSQTLSRFCEDLIQLILQVSSYSFKYIIQVIFLINIAKV